MKEEVMKEKKYKILEWKNWKAELRNKCLLLKRPKKVKKVKPETVSQKQ